MRWRVARSPCADAILIGDHQRANRGLRLLEDLECLRRVGPPSAQLVAAKVSDPAEPLSNRSRLFLRYRRRELTTRNRDQSVIADVVKAAFRSH
jgi:hypothetical protein